MASNILKNNSFGGPTYFDRRWATCLGAVDKRAELGWPSSKGKGWPAAVCKSGPRLCSFTVIARKQKKLRTSLGQKIPTLFLRFGSSYKKKLA